MKLSNALKKMSQYGTVQQDVNRGTLSIRIGSYLVECHSNPPYNKPETDVVTFRTIRDGDEDDIQQDYFAGCHWDNLTQALRYASKSMEG